MLLGNETKSGYFEDSCWQPFVDVVESRDFEYSVGPANTVGAHAEANSARIMECIEAVATI